MHAHESGADGIWYGARAYGSGCPQNPQGVHVHENPWPQVANTVIEARERPELVCFRLMARPDGLPATSLLFWGGPHNLGGHSACVFVPG